MKARKARWYGGGMETYGNNNQLIGPTFIGMISDGEEKKSSVASTLTDTGNCGAYRAFGVRCHTTRFAPLRNFLMLQLLIQIGVNGLMMGLVYIMMALGFTLIFGIMRIVNFAHGEFYMLGAIAVMLLFFPRLESITFSR